MYLFLTISKELQKYDNQVLIIMEHTRFIYQQSIKRKTKNLFLHFSSPFIVAIILPKIIIFNLLLK